MTYSVRPYSYFNLERRRSNQHAKPKAEDRSEGERNARIAAGAVAKSASLTQGFVYFVACGPYIKIGYSFWPRDRVRRMATNNPYDCELIGLLTGGTILEGQIHKRFSHLHYRNEWFHSRPEIMAAVKEMCGDWAHLAIPEKGAPKSLIDEPLRQLGWK